MIPSAIADGNVSRKIKDAVVLEELWNLEISKNRNALKMKPGKNFRVKRLPKKPSDLLRKLVKISSNLRNLLRVGGYMQFFTNSGKKR